jgi:RNA polymerase sigma factor (sigma-70 family)
MAIRLGGRAMQEIRTLFDRGTMGSWSDEQLLAEFASGEQASEPALRVLVERHAPMVLGISRRILGNEDAAEDACQATFLVLVRKADSLRGCRVLSNWIYGVALRVARKERARAARRRVVERGATDTRARWPDEDIERAELRTVIDEEIERLPERYRMPVILCYLEGLRHDEVARRLGCPVGTVESRLSRARDRLRARLTRRGLAPMASVIGFILSPPDASAAIPLSAIVERTVAAAIGLSCRRAGILTWAIHAWGRLIQALSPTIHAGIGVSAAGVIGIGLVALGLFSVLGAGHGPRRPDGAVAEPPPGTQAPIDQSRSGSEGQDRPPPATQEEPKAETPKPGQDQETLPGRRGDSRRADTTDRPKPTRASAAYAPQLNAIVIDGQLDDWPAAIPRHPIEKLYQSDRTDSYGDGGLKVADLRTNSDLSAAFSVGYDPREQLLYLAVVVRDDKLVIGHASHLDTDALEVYVDGLCSDRQIPFPGTTDAFYALDPAGVPVQQYVAIPGRGMIYGMRQASNPILIHGTARNTRTRMAYTRKGDVTTYEWAIQVFDRYPDRPARLEPGKRIGFDVAVADKDVPATSPGGYNERKADRAAWIYWGPVWRGMKVLDASALGQLILVQ